MEGPVTDTASKLFQVCERSQDPAPAQDPTPAQDPAPAQDPSPTQDPEQRSSVGGTPAEEDPERQAVRSPANPASVPR